MDHSTEVATTDLDLNGLDLDITELDARLEMAPTNAEPDWFVIAGSGNVN